jgi:hypothetical protein
MTIDGTERKFRLNICHFFKLNNLADIMESLPTLDKWIKGATEEGCFFTCFPQMTNERFSVCSFECPFPSLAPLYCGIDIILKKKKLT